MNVVLWVVSGVLAAAFLGAGSMKILRTPEQLKSSGMGWVEDFSPAMVKTIGALEVLAALGLILPGVFGVATVLVPLAALGLVLMMIGAVVVHLRRHEVAMMAPSAILGLLALFVAIFRFGSYSL